MPPGKAGNRPSAVSFANSMEDEAVKHWATIYIGTIRAMACLLLYSLAQVTEQQFEGETLYEFT
jgi:hypothetical protein